MGTSKFLQPQLDPELVEPFGPCTSSATDASYPTVPFI
jgi:hypothetical protein